MSSNEKRERLRPKANAYNPQHTLYLILARKQDPNFGDCTEVEGYPFAAEWMHMPYTSGASIPIKPSIK